MIPAERRSPFWEQPFPRSEGNRGGYAALGSLDGSRVWHGGIPRENLARPPALVPCTSHRSFLSIVGQGSECEQVMRDPKGDELLQNTAKPWETAVEAGRCTDVQFVCWSLV